MLNRALLGFFTLNLVWNAVYVQGTTVRIGLLAPYNGTECEFGATMYYGALRYASELNDSPELSGRGIKLEIAPLEASNSLSAWISTTSFASESAGSDAVNVAVLGPPSSAAASHVQFLSAGWGLSMLGYGASSPALTEGLGGDARDPTDSLFLRVGWSDEMITSGLWKLVEHFEWDRVNVLYAETAAGRASLESFQRRAEDYNSKSSVRKIVITAIVGFPSQDLGPEIIAGKDAEEKRRRQELDEALNTLKSNSGRIIVLLANTEDASTAIRRAHAKKMTGKGWTWLGGAWTDDAWADESRSVAFEGVVGVSSVPRGGEVVQVTNDPSLSDAYSVRQYSTGPSGSSCPAIGECSVASPCEFAHDALLSIVEEGIASVAAAAVDLVSDPESASCPFGRNAGAICSTWMEERIRRGWRTNEARNWGVSDMTFTPAGDRIDLPMQIVNIQNGKPVTVAKWKRGKLPSKCIATASQNAWDDDQPVDPAAERGWAGCDIGAGSWEWLRTVVWPGGTTAVPPDRVVLPELTAALVVFAMLTGIFASVALGQWLHARPQISRWIPESGATILLGVLLGGILRGTSDREVYEAAGFDETLFALALLPVIIFESGYALDKHPFFSQIGSIVTFAVFGTLIATLLVGSILYGLGSSGAIHTRFSFEEAMSFAALICAVDPVATLAVFGSLGVDPRLNALVYGEAVINDAVAIVLFRTFSKFLTQEASPDAIGGAFGQFVGIFVGSVAIGVGVGLFTTAFFRVVRITFGGGIRPPGVARARIELDEAEATPTGAGEASPEQIALTETPYSAATDSPVRPCYGCGCNIGDVSGVVQTSFLLLMGYASFSLAEGAGLSGIVSSLAAGIAMNHYTKRVLSPSGRRMAANTFKMLAQLAETAVFFSVGVNVVLFFGDVDAGLTVATVILCLFARAVGTFPLAAGLNLVRKHKIPFNHQVVQWHSGLRGAIAYATSLIFPTQHREEVINTTAWTIFLTIFILGGTTQPLLQYLKIEIDPHGHKTQVDDSDVPDTPATAAVRRAQDLELSREAQRESRVKAALAWADRSFVRPTLYTALSPDDAIAAADEERRWQAFESETATKLRSVSHTAPPTTSHSDESSAQQQSIELA